MFAVRCASDMRGNCNYSRDRCGLERKPVDDISDIFPPVYETIAGLVGTDAATAPCIGFSATSRSIARMNASSSSKK